MPSFEQSRETVIGAPAAGVHALIADFHEWIRWSPWEGLDPALQRTYNGEGVGATYHWSGNKKAGEGEMRFTEIDPDRVVVDLDFLKPFKASNVVTFDLSPAAGGTRVVWTMSGQRSPLFAVMGKLFFDKAIAKDFDRGLASMKSVAEA